MARYVIQHRYSTGHTEEHTRSRKDAAEYLLRRLVREELVAGWAGLDTEWGWKLCRKAAVVASDILRGVPVGWTERLCSEHPMHGGEALTITRLA